jgi:TolA-binding protein
MRNRHGLCMAIWAVSTLFWFSLPANSQHGAGGGMNAGAGSRTSPTNPVTNSGTSTTPDIGGRGLYLSGKVQMADGAVPPEQVLIERVCGAGYRKAEGYTDSKGHFSFQLGQEQGVTADATFETATGGPSASNGSSGGANKMSASGANSAKSASSRSLVGCELTASLPGFRSESVNLDQRRRLDNPDVGTLILHRLANVVADTTGRLLKLDATDFPEAYYYNAAANFRLKKLSDAESSARETLKLDTAHRFPQAAHILGIVLYQKHDFAGAAEQLRNYLQIAPNAPDAAQAKGQLAELEHLATASNTPNAP